jgi:signal transduction histidine kinase
MARGFPPVVPKGSQLYDARNVPEKLRQLAPGYHRLAKPEDRYLFVFEVNNQRYYLLQESQKYGYLELVIDGFAPLVIMLCILCAYWIGRLTSARVTIPITRLAEVVQRKQKPLPYQDANDEIGILARAFAQHSDELERFLQRERCFVGDASHELRTPLAFIAGAAETIAHQLPADSHLVQSAERIVHTTRKCSVS